MRVHITTSSSESEVYTRHTKRDSPLVYVSVKYPRDCDSHRKPTRDTLSWLSLDRTAKVLTTVTTENTLLSGAPAAIDGKATTVGGAFERSSEFSHEFRSH